MLRLLDGIALGIGVAVGLIGIGGALLWVAYVVDCVRRPAADSDWIAAEVQKATGQRPR